MAKAKRQHKYEPDYAVAPGETLRDTLVALDMSQRDLAKRTSLTVQTVSRILGGEQPITFETANKLDMVTGVPARMWNKLEMKYREQLSKIVTGEKITSNYFNRAAVLAVHFNWKCWCGLRNRSFRKEVQLRQQTDTMISSNVIEIQTTKMITKTQRRDRSGIAECVLVHRESIILRWRTFFGFGRV